MCLQAFRDWRKRKSAAEKLLKNVLDCIVADIDAADVSPDTIKSIIPADASKPSDASSHGTIMSTSYASDTAGFERFSFQTTSFNNSSYSKHGLNIQRALFPALSEALSDPIDSLGMNVDSQNLRYPPSVAKYSRAIKGLEVQGHTSNNSIPESGQGVVGQWVQNSEQSVPGATPTRKNSRPEEVEGWTIECLPPILIAQPHIADKIKVPKTHPQGPDKDQFHEGIPPLFWLSMLVIAGLHLGAVWLSMIGQNKVMLLSCLGVESAVMSSLTLCVMLWSRW